MITLQVQPEDSRKEEYLALAKGNGLRFELMSFAFPAVLDSPEKIRAICGQYRDAPVTSLHGVFIDINYSGGDRRIFAESKRRMEQCLTCANMVGAENVVFHSCFLPVLRPDDPLYDLWSDESARLLGELCDRFGVRIFIENMLDRTPDILLKMMQKANRPDIGVCLDVGHANFSVTPISQWVETLAPYIGYVHLSDNHGAYDEHLAVGDGNIDWQAFFELVRQYRLNPVYTLETKPKENILRSLSALRKLGVME